MVFVIIKLLEHRDPVGKKTLLLQFPIPCFPKMPGSDPTIALKSPRIKILSCLEVQVKCVIEGFLGIKVNIKYGRIHIDDVTCRL